MADALKLTEVATDKGFKRRIAYFMTNKALLVLQDGTPDANDLALAKLITQNGVDTYVAEFSIMIVTIDSVANALDTANYDHTTVADSAIETGVNAMYPDFAKGYA